MKRIIFAGIFCAFFLLSFQSCATTKDGKNTEKQKIEKETVAEKDNKKSATDGSGKAKKPNVTKIATLDGAKKKTIVIKRRTNSGNSKIKPKSTKKSDKVKETEKALPEKTTSEKANSEKQKSEKTAQPSAEKKKVSLKPKKTQSEKKDNNKKDNKKDNMNANKKNTVDKTQNAENKDSSTTGENSTEKNTGENAKPKTVIKKNTPATETSKNDAKPKKAISAINNKPKSDSAKSDNKKSDTAKTEFNDPISEATNKIVDTKKPYDKSSKAYSGISNSDNNEKEEFVISRRVKMRQGQRLVVTYPGEKWVFLGEETSKKGLYYEQRKFQKGDTQFRFFAGKTGDYILHFSRFDVYSDKFILDALGVSVAEKVASAPAKVYAPKYVLPVNKNPKSYGEAKNGIPATGGKKASKAIVNPANDIIIHNDETAVISASAGELLKKARNEIAHGKAKDAIATLNDFFVSSSTRLDEGWFLRGQAYEINGPEKNIKAAYASYKTLVQTFPESDYWDKADERIRYIKRFFVNIE
ncbi:MAG: hypothetical protein CR988_02225 [Treponema sp.]|nr:MAG: hypothetical protein CR988_02225 [Treponema sp.]